MSRNDCVKFDLLLSYVSLLAERHAYGRGDNFEFLLWDDLLKTTPTLVSLDEKKSLCNSSFDVMPGRRLISKPACSRSSTSTPGPTC